MCIAFFQNHFPGILFSIITLSCKAFHDEVAKEKPKEKTLPPSQKNVFITNTLTQNFLYRTYIALLVFLSILFAVQILSFFTFQRYEEMPVCPPSSLNCVHFSSISLATDYNSHDVPPLTISASLPSVRTAVHVFLKKHYFVTIEHDDENFVHATILSFFFGIPDHFIVSWKCDPDRSLVLFEIHAESQIWGFDYHGNHERVLEFVEWMNDYDWITGGCAAK